MVVDLEFAAAPDQAQLAGFQDPAIVIAQDRQQDRIAKNAVAADPSPRRSSRPSGSPGPFSRTSHHQTLRRSVIAMWLGTMSRTCPRPLAAQTLDEARVGRGAAQLLVDPGGIDHVIPVGAAPRCLEIGRAVEMGDAEIGQVVQRFLRRRQIRNPRAAGPGRWRKCDMRHSTDGLARDLPSLTLQEARH